MSDNLHQSKTLRNLPKNDISLLTSDCCLETDIILANYGKMKQNILKKNESKMSEKLENKREWNLK